MTIISVQATELASVKRDLAANPKRRHFRTLDGLRGVAALCVFLVHCFSRHIAPNGFLGVDFFFMLSGFVIAAAYSERLATGSLSLREFCLRRYERLWPMLVVGTMFGLTAALFHNLSHPREAYSLVGLSLLAASSLLLVPQVKSIAVDNTAFPLNTVVWSLFFEVLANLVYAALARFIGLRSAVALATTGLTGMLIFGTEGGGSLPDLCLGIPRVLFGFFAGVSLWKLQSRGSLKAVPRFGLAALALPLLAITFIPFQIHGLCFVAVALVFLALIASGAQDNPSGLALNTCVVLGATSYPFYLIHRPLLYIVPGLAKKLMPMEGVGYGMAVVATLSVSLALSLALEKFYEIPVRRWLRAALLPEADE